ncbi:conjugal transfer protein TraD [Candidatus Rickettsia colombianensi]|uniref:conjugal transfer protein TraD n=1 Tax=Candidatus Rickettsia colombianensi TaxID=1090944 RepID=UPI001FE3B427|nr:conjugal transfer protein TraD [Candidatus Rickettsia colombianensi]
MIVNLTLVKRLCSADFKAGLDYLHPNNAHILYGMLLDCKEQLIVNPKIIDKWKSKGQQLLKKSI